MSDGDGEEDDTRTSIAKNLDDDENQILKVKVCLNYEHHPILFGPLLLQTLFCVHFHFKINIPKIK